MLMCACPVCKGVRMTNTLTLGSFGRESAVRDASFSPIVSLDNEYWNPKMALHPTPDSSN